MLADTNDVIAGIIFYGTWLYMQEMSGQESTATINATSNESNSTALVLLNTRMLEEMTKPEAEMPWGNLFLPSCICQFRTWLNFQIH